MREVKKSVYNVSRPNHFGSIRKMPVRPEVATEREESQAEMPYEELKQKVAQFEQSKITPALETSIRALPRETGWSWTTGIRINIYRQTSQIPTKGAHTDYKLPQYSTSVEDMGIMQEQDVAYESPDRSPKQHTKNLDNAATAMKEIYEEAGYTVQLKWDSPYWYLIIKRVS